MNVLIIEDEQAIARRLEKLIQEIEPDFHVIDIIDTVEDSISFLQRKQAPDLIFMDIHLADGNSFEIFEKVTVRSPVIFTTAYDQYAIRAFKVNSIDYLLKPLKKNELETAIEKFKSTVKSKVSDYSVLLDLLKSDKKEFIKRFMVRVGQEIKALDITDIAYFLIENKGLYAVMNNGKRYLSDFTMDQLEQQLDPMQFFRINRSMIISYRAINKMISYSKSRIKIELNPPCSDDAITSTERSAAFKEWLTAKS